MPPDWVSADIGQPNRPGDVAYSPATGNWTVTGGGADIGGTADQFHFASESWVDDGSITARVGSIENTDPWAKAGVMFRGSADPSAPFADVVATPGNGVAFQWRDTFGGQAQDGHVTGLAAPVWVQLLRSGDDFSAFYSSDGVTWTPIGETQTVPVGTTPLAGLAVTAHDNNALTSASFTHVSVLPAGWTAGDIGAPGLPGSSIFDPIASGWSVAGSGADIWGASDQFHLAGQSFTGDGSLTARVGSIQNTDPWAKAGVMIRDQNAANAPFADVVASPGNGVAFQWRTTPGDVPNNVNVTGLFAPVWVRLERAGNDFSAFYSAEGSQWTQIGATQTIAMSSTVLVGLAVTAHNNSALCNVAFTDVSLTAPGPAPSPASRSVGYNQTGLVNDGVPFSGGRLDGNSNAYSANLLGSSLTAAAVPLHLGAADGNTFTLNLSDWQSYTQGMSRSTWWQAMLPDDGLLFPPDWEQ